MRRSTKTSNKDKAQIKMFEAIAEQSRSMNTMFNTMMTLFSNSMNSRVNENVFNPVSPVEEKINTKKISSKVQPKEEYTPSEVDPSEKYENPENFMLDVSTKFHNNNIPKFKSLKAKFKQLNDNTFNSLITITTDDVLFQKPLFIPPENTSSEYLEQCKIENAYIPYFVLTYYNSSEEAYAELTNYPKINSFILNWLDTSVDGITTYNTISMNENPTEEASKKTVINNITKDRNTNFVRNDRFIAKNSIPLTTIQQMFAGTEYADKVIGSEFTYISGMITSFDFNYPKELTMTYSNLLPIIDYTKSLFSTNLSISDNVWIIIYLNYLSTDGTSTKKVPFLRYRGAAEDIKRQYLDIKNNSTDELPLTYKLFLDEAGSDSNFNEKDYILTQTITISGLVLIRSGGSDGQISHIIQSILQSANSDNDIIITNKIADGTIKKKTDSNKKIYYTVTVPNGLITLFPSTTKTGFHCFYTACKNDSAFYSGYKLSHSGSLTEKKLFDECKLIYPDLTNDQNIDANTATDLFYRLSGIPLIITDLTGQVNTAAYNKVISIDPTKFTEMKPSTIGLVDNHYFNFKPTNISLISNLKQSENNVDILANKGYKYDININVYFDVETVFISRVNNTEVNNKLQIYSISYRTTNTITISDNPTSKLSKDINIIPMNDINHTIISDKPDSLLMINDMIIHIRSSFEKQIMSKEYRSLNYNTSIDAFRLKVNFIAYNGSNFDFVPLFEYFNTLSFETVKPIYGTGKLNSFLFVEKSYVLPYDLVNKKNTKPLKFSFTCWDPNNFVNGSLQDVCKSFGLPLMKEEISHKNIQTAFDNDKFGEFIQENGELIKQYNKNDVDMLFSLTTVLLSNLSELTEESVQFILNCPTLANLGYKVLKKMNVYKLNSVELPYDAETYDLSFEQFDNLDLSKEKSIGKFSKVVNCLTNDLDDLVRNSMVAGRNSYDYIGTQKGKLEQIDVVSLYPYVCNEREYPVGDAIKFKEKDFNTLGGKIFFINVQFDQKNIRNKYGYYLSDKFHGYNYYPARNKDLSLNWNTEEVLTAFIPHVTYFDLKEEGVQLSSLPIDEEGNIGIYWNESASVFTEYMEKYKKGKMMEDAKPENERNKAWRELCKLLLNSVTGKVIEKKRKSTTMLYTSPYDLEKDLSSIDLTELSNIEFSGIGKNGFVTLPNKYVEDEESKTPSYLGALLYAYARSHMWNTCIKLVSTKDNNLGGIKYMDTDSAVVNRIGSDKLHELGYIGNRFGQYTYDKYSEIQVAGKKMYRLINTDKNKVRLKGINKKDLVLDRNGKELGMVENMYDYIFRELMNGRSINILSFEFVNILPKNIWMHRNIIKQINSNTDIKVEIEEDSLMY